MRKVALVTDIAFWSNSYGSHMRIQGLIRHLAQNNDLHIFFLGSLPRGLREKLESMGLGGINITSYKSHSGLNHQFDARVAKSPMFKTHKVPTDFVSSLKDFLEHHHFDAIILEYIRLAYLLDACPPDMTTMLDMHDVMSARSISLGRAGLRASIEVTAAVERDLLRQFDRVLAISRADVATAKRFVPADKIIYAPHSVTIPTDHQKPIGDGKRLFFVGANSAPNIEGLKWFLDQVWPMLEPEGFVLDVVGNICSSFPDSLPGVVMHGQVDDMSAMMDAADIAINPVFVGGGIKIKCIDALAAGLPCITTIEGASGLDGAIGAGLVVARSRLKFAAAVRYFAQSAEARRIVAITAPQFIDRELRPESAYGALQSFIDGMPCTVPALT